MKNNLKKKIKPVFGRSGLYILYGYDRFCNNSL